jgi:hypothetical protein
MVELSRRMGSEVVRSYLDLAMAAIGRGYLFPASAGMNPCTWLWTRALPETLPRLSAEAAAKTLARAWNLAENLESGPPWLRQISLLVMQGWGNMEDLEGLLGEVRRVVFDPPEPGTTRVHLAGHVLPGPIHFMTPAVVCVHDRHAVETATALWGGKVLCSMACPEVPSLAGTDEETYSTAVCEGRSASTLWTSQFVVLG